jgi:hypothetical protein
LARPRDFVTGRVYYTVYREDAKKAEPTVLSFRYTGRRDAEGRHVFQVLGAPPDSEMILEPQGQDSMLDLKGLVQDLTGNAS